MYTRVQRSPEIICVEYRDQSIMPTLDIIPATPIKLNDVLIHELLKPHEYKIIGYNSWNQCNQYIGAINVSANNLSTHLSQHLPGHEAYKIPHNNWRLVGRLMNDGLWIIPFIAVLIRV